MKEIKLKNITLSNWKSLNANVQFNEGKTIIKGRNGIGKTSLQSAWNWLLSSYTNSITPKNFELFDNRVELSPDTPIASVIAIVSVDGIEYSLQKTAEAKFTRPRGSSEHVKDKSDVYRYYIDNIEVSATNFTEWVRQNICPDDMLVYCLSGDFFATLCEDDKTKARKVLEQLVGEIKPTDFKGDYSILSDMLGKYSIEMIEERTKKEKKPYEDRLALLPKLIEQNENLINEFNKVDFDALFEKMQETKQEIELIDNQMLGRAEAIKPILGQRDAIFEIINSKTLKVNERRNTYLAQFNARKSEIKAKIEQIDNENTRIKRNNDLSAFAYDHDCDMLDFKRKELELIFKEQQSLREKRDEVKSRTFDGGTCVYCGQELPLDKIEEKKAIFNKHKEEELTNIVAQGKNNKVKIDELEKHIAELQRIKDAGLIVNSYINKDELVAELSQYESTFVPFEETDEYKAMWKEIEDLKTSLPQIPQNDNSELNEAKKTLIAKLEGLNREYGVKDKANELKLEVIELQKEQREVVNKIAYLEGVLAKCREWVEERANIISERINGKLEYCQIQMWQTQKNGEKVPACIITSTDGVKYATLNNSNRIKTCISLQQLFCEHFGIEMPIFIDESSIFDSKNLPVVKNQTIYLYASDDNYLVVS